MAQLSYEPRIGDEVSVKGHSGRFKIVEASPSANDWRFSKERSSHGWVDVSELKTGVTLKGIPWTALNLQEIVARRVIEALQAEHKFPGTIVSFDVESGIDNQGNSALYMTFYVESDESPSNGTIVRMARNFCVS